VGAFSAGADWALAARILSIPRSTLRRAIEADAGLMERVEDARAQADEVVIKSLYTKATAPSASEPVRERDGSLGSLSRPQLLDLRALGGREWPNRAHVLPLDAHCRATLG